MSTTIDLEANTLVEGDSQTSFLLTGRRASYHATAALQRLVAQIENEPGLAEPDQLRERLEVLDGLEALDLSDAYSPCDRQAADVCERLQQQLHRRAEAIRNRFEAMNRDLYTTIRKQIQCGLRLHDLLRRIHPSTIGNLDTSAQGMGYDWADELVSGLLQCEEPDDWHIPRDAEKSFYQPTPARHIFRLIGLARLTASDVFVDLGSGMGHVPILVGICTSARGIGIELEATYVERARQCALGLKLEQVTFLQDDARAADLSFGTVFYLYSPFMGSILRVVLDRLKCEAAIRRIRICSYGPCTLVVAQESWLRATTVPDAHSITVFCSRA